ncbi:phage tail protein [Pseudomonas sp. B14(2017)]|uniref:phage tail protein n=1 Tax=Pseudomonas sp. B14(2017) TaxID=1981745 RepID=UPI000A1F2659|nr:phage tail protein [Pseudomonas sp. B14(2017)]
MASAYDEATLYSADELEAVNDMLAAIGESPVNTLEDGSNADVANCRRLLAKVNQEVQARGWTFNIETDATLTPDVFSKLITWEDSFLRVMVDGSAGTYTNRGGYVYDRTNKTDEFDDPITVSLIRLKSFSEMPVPFRSYIIAKASRRFNIRFFGASEIEATLQEEENDAWVAVQEYELDYGVNNMLDGDSWTSGRISR